MKTTYLFKMHGAWSPLWNLSDEKFFEIKSHDFWANVSCKMAPPSLDNVFHMIESELQKHIGQPALSNICFSEYQDPNSFNAGACEPVAMEKMFGQAQMERKIKKRADEIFGIYPCAEKFLFMHAMLSGKTLVRRMASGFVVEPITD